MLTVKGIQRILHFSESYGGNDGACFGTADPSRLRPYPNAEINLLARKRQRPDMLNVARVIIRLRQGAGLSQEKLAQRVGMTKQDIARLERPSYKGHTFKTFQRIAEALGYALEIKLARVRKA